MKHIRQWWREGLLAAFLIANLSVWPVVFAQAETGALHVYFLDVGQGDAVFISSPTQGRVLIDGGPNNKVLSELGRILPFGDRRIDVVMATHPDADHITGLVEVLKTYDVDVFIEPGVESDNNIDDALDEEVEEKGIQEVIARRGLQIDLGGEVRLEILFPDRDVSGWETNDASIVAKLTYGEDTFLFTGDAAKKTEYILLGLDKAQLDVDVLKAGHHGSKTSTSLQFAEAASPEYAVISAGKDNRYGHPAQEVLDVLEQVNAIIFSTIDSGTIEFESSGAGIIKK